MSRLIKFRLWDNSTKHMFPNASPAFSPATNKMTVFVTEQDSYGWDFDNSGVHQWEYDDYDNIYNSTDDVTLLQFTGLKDKNGVEIYEGDIGTFTSLRGVEHTVSVSFEDGAFIGKGSIYTNVSPSKLVIVGNIYENPELLKGGDK